MSVGVYQPGKSPHVPPQDLAGGAERLGPTTIDDAADDRLFVRKAQLDLNTHD